MTAKRPPTHIELVRDNVVGRLSAARAQLEKMQPVPIDSIARSPKEREAFRSMLGSLPSDIRQATMSLMAERAGHQQGESAPCELCQFVAEGVPKVIPGAQPR